jgi:hypothetical protein
MTKTQRPPKYFGKYRTKRELLAAVRAHNEMDPKSHYFDRKTIKFFGAYKHTIEVDATHGVLIASHCRVPAFSGFGRIERVSYHVINDDLSIGRSI